MTTVTRKLAAAVHGIVRWVTGARWAQSGNYRLLAIGTLERFQGRDGQGRWADRAP